MAFHRRYFALWILTFTFLAALSVCNGDFIHMAEEHLDKLSEIINSFFTFPTDYKVEDGEEFEYVVVGAGAAGAAVASRLALAGFKVILLEAGGHAPPHAYVPGMAMASMGSPIDWKYKTLPNNVSCLGAEGLWCPWSRGKVLGGSTTINYMMYVRGNRKDYDFGIPGWTWEDMEPYFLRYEGIRNESLQKLPPTSVPYHNTSGTMKVGLCGDSKNTWHQRLVEGFENLGLEFNPDVNAKTQIGISRVVTYTNNGARESTASGYLHRDDVKKALRISIDTYVTRVLFDENNRARAVTAVHGILNKKLTIHATKGVILCAGAIESPRILQHSGIGPKNLLQKYNVPLLVDLPVGEEVSDHVLPLLFISVETPPLYALRYGPALIEYELSREGPLASVGLTDISAFLNTSCYDPESRLLRSGDGCELPTLQTIHAFIERGILGIEKPAFKLMTNLNDDILSQVTKENESKGLIEISAVVLHPYSRGHIRINSEDPMKQPEIFPNYLDDIRDIQELLRTMTIMEHLVETLPFRERNATILHIKLKDCPSYESDREAYWTCYVRHLTFSVFHAAGSCALGKVLDPSMGVIGVENLYVADMSAVPQVPRGNTAAVSIAMGERLADILIKKSSGN